MRCKEDAKNWRKWFQTVAAAVCLIFVVMLTGCSKNQMDVTITDRQTTTKFTAKSDLTVEKLLEEAEIPYDEADEIVPSLHTKMTGNNATIHISRHVKVSVLSDNQNESVELTGGTVADALKQAGVSLKKKDSVNHDLMTYLTDGMEICVVRRLGITLVVGGKSQDVLTTQKDVASFLKEQGVTLGKHDRVEPKLKAELKDGSKVVVKRVEIKKETRTEAIAYDTKQTYSPSRAAGTRKVTQKGVPGKKKVTYRVTYVDGKEESREKVSEKVVKKAVNQVIVQGTKKKSGKTIVSKKRVDDCDGSGHGYYIITYSDGTVKYENY
ncbi:MAG: ubiquitin-like domain-containing protein [Clostridiales bacterium]|nr:ubiquitin-like domain-containing protein [Clostridiales bacterium]